jgi:hypothetical protein
MVGYRPVMLSAVHSRIWRMQLLPTNDGREKYAQFRSDFDFANIFQKKEIFTCMKSGKVDVCMNLFVI